MVRKGLVFDGLLVLYWLHIGPHEYPIRGACCMSMRKSTLIATAVSLALAKAAAADSEQAANPAGEEIETVLVTGIRASLKESLAVKRDSQTVVDVITSADVGKFPDKNVA